MKLSSKLYIAAFVLMFGVPIFISSIWGEGCLGPACPTFAWNSALALSSVFLGVFMLPVASGFEQDEDWGKR